MIGYVDITASRLVAQRIPLTHDSTVALVEHTPGAQAWVALRVDGQHYNLVLWKHTVGRPEVTAAVQEALAATRRTIWRLRQEHARELALRLGLPVSGAAKWE